MTTTSVDIPEAFKPLGEEEVADYFGWNRRTVHQWRFRESTLFPAEDFIVNGQPAWMVCTIAEWALDTGRLEADDPKAVFARPKAGASR